MMTRLALYLITLGSTILLLIWGQQLHQADWHAPFSYQGDALLILPMVQETIQKGSHWTTPRLGAPGQQELYDFPVVDHLHFVIIWLLGRFSSDTAVVFNLFHVLTYPLTALSTLFVLRQLGLSAGASFAGALLYAFFPHHYLRGMHHYFLAAYFVVPLSCWVMIRGTSGEPLSRKSWLAGAIIAVLTASAGAYYAFFACALLAMGAVYAVLILRSWRSTAFLSFVTGLIVLAGVINHWPAIVYQAEHGRNSAPHTRTAEEVEEYSLKLTQLVLPVEQHRWRFLARLSSAYDSSFRPVQTENRASTLGLIASIGLLALLVRLLLPLRPSWPYTPLAVLTGFALLYGFTGGFSSLFAFLISPQIRCPNRISIYLGFFALFALLSWIDRSPISRFPRLRQVSFLLLTLLGLADQLNRPWFSGEPVRQREQVAELYRADAAFFAEVERQVQAGKVFQLPFVPYPETLRVEGLSGYDQARGYLHTTQTRWSFGTMKGRVIDQVFREWCREPKTILTKLHDWQGLYLDRRGFKPAIADELVAYFDEQLGREGKLLHPDGQQLFWPLHPDRLPAGPASPNDFERVRILWLNGFSSFEPPGEEWRHRWCSRSGEAMIINPSSEERAIRLSGLFRSETTQNVKLKISSELAIWNEELAINRFSQPIERTLIVPPGEHRLRFEATPARDWMPTDSRRHLFFLAQFQLIE